MQRGELLFAGIFVALMATVSHPQTDSLQNYFPLHIGEVRKYYYEEALPNTIVGQTFSVRDTIRLGGKLYFDYVDSHGLSVLYRSEGHRVYRWIENKDVLWFDFTAAVGDTYSVNFSGSWKPNVVILSKTAVVRARAGAFTNCYLLLFDDPKAVDDAMQYWFAPDLGIVKMLWPHFIRPVLHSATVNGRHYPGPVLAVEQHQSKISQIFSIAAVYPNPFSLEQNFTTIRYTIPTNIPSAGVSVELKIYNLLGQVVRVLAIRQQTPGEYSIQWNGADEAGRLVPAGVYLVRLVAGDPSAGLRRAQSSRSGRRFVAERKVVVLR